MIWQYWNGLINLEYKKAIYNHIVCSRINRNSASEDILEPAQSLSIMFKLWQLGVLRASLLARLP